MRSPSCECKIASRWFWLRVNYIRILSLSRAFLTFIMVLFQGEGWPGNLRWPGLLRKDSTVLGDKLLGYWYWGLGQILGLGLSFIKYSLCCSRPASMPGGGWTLLCFSELLEKTDSTTEASLMVNFHFYLLQALIL